MRITLTEKEIFEALTDFVGKTMKIDPNADVKISLTAGRNPKGYYADIDITNPPSEMAVKCQAVVMADDGEPQGDNTSDQVGSVNIEPTPVTTPDIATNAVKSAEDIFSR